MSKDIVIVPQFQCGYGHLHKTMESAEHCHKGYKKYLDRKASEPRRKIVHLACAFDFFENGLNFRQIAKQYGVSSTTVETWICQHLGRLQVLNKMEENFWHYPGSTFPKRMRAAYADLKARRKPKEELA